MPLPLRRLPFLALKEIFHSTDLSDLVMLALLNRRLRNLIGAANYPVKHFRFHLECHMLSITTDSEKLWVKAMVAGQYLNESRKHYIKIEKEMKTVTTGKKNGDTEICVISRKRTKANQWILFEWLSRFLISIVRPETFSLYCATDEVNFVNLFVWSITDRFTSVTFQTGYPIPQENIEFLLTNIHADELSLAVLPMNEDYKFGGSSNIVPKIREVDIRTSKWVDFKNFIQTIRYPVVKCSVYWSETINHILKQWICAMDETLEKLCMDMGHGRRMERPIVLKGIDATPNILTEEQMFRCCGVHRRNHVEYLDIKRSTDGRLATIVLAERSVSLHLWVQDHLDQI